MRAAKLRQAPRQVCGAGDAYNGGLALYQVACTVLGASSSTLGGGLTGLPSLKGSVRRTLATTSSVRSEESHESVREVPTSTTAHEDARHSAVDSELATAQNNAPRPSNSDEPMTAENSHIDQWKDVRKKTFGMDKILPNRTQRHRSVSRWTAHPETVLQEWSEDRPFVIRTKYSEVPPEDLHHGLVSGKFRGGLRGAEEARRKLNEQRSRLQTPAKATPESLLEVSESISSPADTTAEVPDDSGPKEAAEAQPIARTRLSRPKTKAGLARTSESTQESGSTRPVHRPVMGDYPLSPAALAKKLGEFEHARHAAYKAKKQIHNHMTRSLQSGVEIKDSVSTDPEIFASLMHTHLFCLRELSAAYKELPKRTSEVMLQLEAASWHNGTPVPPYWPHVELGAAGPAPWEQVDAQQLTGKALLNEEIRRFEVFMKLTPQEAAARRGVLHEVERLRDRCLKDALVETFGSSKTDLMRPDSDLDVRIYRPAQAEKKNTELRPNDDGDLKDLKNCVRVMRNGAFRGDWIAPTARLGKFPIVNVQHAPSAIDVQLLWATEDSGAQQTCTQMAIDEEPYLPLMFQIVRTMLAARGLLDVFSGGLGSYGTFCMVATAMRWSPKDASPRKTPADMLLHVLRFFAMRLPQMAGLRRKDEHKAAIESAKLASSLSSDSSGTSESPSPAVSLPAGVRPVWYSRDTQPRAVWFTRSHGGDHVRSASTWREPTHLRSNPYQSWLVSYPDPAENRNDLAIKAIGIKYIFATMRYYLKDLEARIEAQDAVATGSSPPPVEEHPTRDSGDGGASNDFLHALRLGEKENAAGSTPSQAQKPAKHIDPPGSLLAPLLGDYHNKVRKQRQTIETYGAAIMQQEEGSIEGGV